MRAPAPPPDLGTIAMSLSGHRVIELLTSTPSGVAGQPYHPWDKLRFRRPPDGLTAEEWWFVTRTARNQMQRVLPLVDAGGRPFTYALPDEVLRALDNITRGASGHISIGAQVVNQADRDRYLITSLIDEAITSSQLEGASTEHAVAKQMIRSGREPRDTSERMILNNFRAMRRVSELTGEDLTPGMVREIHAIVAEGTIEQDQVGRFQSGSDERVSVQDAYGNTLHAPPPARELPERVERLCDFANGREDGAYVPPVLRAITVHFMIGYDHPFADGNGRTARALFYWSMLRQGYWLTEYLAISRFLREAPASYARSFLHSEQDGNDLTYFHAHQLVTIERAMAHLHGYLARKADDTRALRLLPGEFNHRQIALLTGAVRRPGRQYTSLSHSMSHNVTKETARLDLLDLERRGLLRRGKAGRASVWVAVGDLPDRLARD